MKQEEDTRPSARRTDTEVQDSPGHTQDRLLLQLLGNTPAMVLKTEKLSWTEERRRREGGETEERGRRDGGGTEERRRRDGGETDERGRREGGEMEERRRRDG
ncbi:unnamed protein product [Pleuronectes platessa]|uniref:Uncharacterized protein n=1 Tax=Pleuronectes platessa TaxID=8262 RepID=A0A9N7TNP6_PLEPL|nr:unnamed protein product [Pleuronectes platessa]